MGPKTAQKSERVYSKQDAEKLDLTAFSPGVQFVPSKIRSKLRFRKSLKAPNFAIRRFWAHLSLDLCGLNRWCQQIPHTHEVVSSGREGKDPPNFE